MLVATAGHIDHGKTALIRALTGVETDRLPEEKSRGISIDLGFAYWRPDAGEVIGFVDVPGHQRFVRNMLAGISGVDFALLVVAADDGIMPQTIEHLRIIELLGIGRGAIAITKCDLASAARIAEVRDAIAELLAGGSLASAPVFELSPTTGPGLGDLARALIAARDKGIERDWLDRGFRLSIDRAFTVIGTGTVVTGTVTAGEARPGAELILSPSGKAIRLRGIQSAGISAERAVAGLRCAFNLAGVELGELHRGDWLVEPALHAPTSRIEVRLELLESLAAPLRHASPVRLHIGAASLPARVLIPRQRSLQPGERTVAVLTLDRPTSAINGERFILRDQSGQVLLGGGQVLDPLASQKRRSWDERAAAAAALAWSEPQQALAALADIAGYEVDTGWFARCFNLRRDEMMKLGAEGDFVSFGKANSSIIARPRFAALYDRVIAAVGHYHTRNRDAGGMTRRELRLGLGETVSGDLLGALLHKLSATEHLIADGALVRLPGHSIDFSPLETSLWRSALAALEDQAPRPIAIADMARELRTSEAAIAAMLLRRSINGDLWQVSDAKYMLREHVAALVATAAELDGASAAGFTAAQFRDATGIGRNFIIQLLEFFDRIGVTRRQGEARCMRADYEAVVGSAAAWHPS